MLTIRKKRRAISVGKLALIALTAIVVLTPKDFDVSPMTSFSFISQTMASESP